ncbi:chemotaxis protein histidine kinase [Rubidibacter lacunae KORDI 51-2]|uniref:histidine kinase n=1 Tax=Rubidibacter lacunae KORDI 51-2 TaxID=582515 RepID=U5DKX5_9CHRO|nr:response regulator [Rubidibacter lacunae]ERN40375.1 chemotaxis protein histidine kinase [Rubidibacter lacunae KORDI 51-2]
MVLDANSLEAIARETRNCFLFEDAPDYQAELTGGLAQLQTGQNTAAAIASLMKAAHSLKGGAGIAQFPELSRLAHKFEDLLETFDRVPDPDAAYRLLERGVAQIDVALAAAARADSNDPLETPALTSICAEFDAFVRALPSAPPPQLAAADVSSARPYPHVVKTALTVDLEDCLQRADAALQLQLSVAELVPALQGFCDECALLGETLEQQWLSAAVLPLSKATEARLAALPAIAGKTVAHVRQQRDRVLSAMVESASPASSPGTAAKSVAKTVSAAVTTAPSSVASHPADVPGLQARMPVARLDRLNNTLGELLVGYERFVLFGEQLQQTSLSLKRRAEQLAPINDRIQTLYDLLATDARVNRADANGDRERTAGTRDDFDPLQLDRYSDLHQPLQELQELMVQVQENRADLDAIDRDYQESLEDLRAALSQMRSDLTDARLIPFRTGVEKFDTALRSLNQRYQKDAVLQVSGEDTLVDRVVLEQLQAPLNHLFRNAFDHGIETPAERIATGKPPTATIRLSANLQGSRVEIAIADDGRGIDEEKVWQAAIARGVHPPTHRPSRREILDCIFAPGLSTARAATDLSGRGVGLDVVRLQVERLRGSVRVDTELGRGTRFVLALPVALSILPLLLCRSQQRAFAIPSSQVLKAISLSGNPNSNSYDRAAPDTALLPEILWENRRLPVNSLAQLLPYAEPNASNASPAFVLVLDVGDTPIAVAIDALEAERELVLKPFDGTVPVPPYLSGCTVLGSGEIVPVLNPSYLGDLLAGDSPAWVPSSPPAPSVTTVLIADDSVAIRRSLERILEQSGYRVVACRDGKEALSALEQALEPFALAITDIEMPQLDGFGLLQAIRAHARWQDLPVVMLTSRDNPRHRETARRLGATDYFGKPFRPQELVAAIARWSKPSK